MTSLALQDIGLKPALLKAVEKKARHEGKSAPEYVRALIERDLLADKSFDEILRPIRADFRKSGVSEDELEAIVKRGRTAARRTQKVRP